MGKSKPKMRVVEYRMTIHFGICMGPVDLRRIYFGDKIGWDSISYDVEDLFIDKKDLFGGIKKEGGVYGSAIFLPGKEDQLLPERICTKYSLTLDEMPGYRGTASLYFTERAGDGRKGFYWTANSPYLRGVWAMVARTPIGLDPATARIYREPPESATGLDFGDGRTGNDPYQWDTYGDYCVWLENSGGTVWKLPTGTTQSIPDPDSSGGGGSCHITEDEELIVRATSAGDRFRIYRLSDMNLRQTLTGIEGGLNFGFAMDSIRAANGDLVALSWTGPAANKDRWVLIRKEAGETSYGLEWNQPVDSGNVGFGNAVDTMSMGPVYGYALTDHSTRKLLRVRWNGTFAEDLITLPGGAGRNVNVAAYLEDTDEVLIIFTNGDLAVYDAALTTLLRENTTDFSSAIAYERGMLSKRISLGGSRIMLPEHLGSGLQHLIHEISTKTLTAIRSTNTADTNFVNKTINYTWSGVNAKHGGLFMAGHFVDSSFWFATPVGDYDVNPAHIIYEAMINKTWGMGTSPDAINFANFDANALTLYNENFGLSFPWVRQTSIEEFCSEVLDHIEATMFVNPRDGLLTLKLIRDDYNIEDLKVFDASNSKITSFKRKLWGETTNEIVVNYTDPENEEQISMSAQDAANIAIQGDIVSSGRDYYGVRVPDLARRLNFRDLRTASAPLASCDIETDRSGWDVLPGDCVVIVSPEDGVEQIVMRVGPVDYGKVGSPTIKSALVEDVFSLAQAQYDIPGDSEWVDPSEEPSTPDYEYAFTLPYYLVVNKVDAGLAGDAEYPTVFTGVLAAEEGEDTAQYDVHGDLTDGAGEPYVGDVGTMTIIAHGLLDAQLDQEAVSTIPVDLVLTQGIGPAVGSIVVIGDGDETEVELAMVTAINSTDVTINRGLLDTTPKEWPIGTPFWYLDAESIFVDKTPRSAGETVEYFILPRTSLGVLDIGLANTLPITLTERPWLPSRPADCKVEGVGFGIADCEDMDPVNVTWVERNRLTEDSVALAWDAATVTPEAGQTTKLTVMDAFDRSVLTVHDGLTGTDFDIPASSFAGVGRVIIKFESERDDLTSLQGHEIEVIVAAGYGYGYGYNYGGA